MDYRYLKAFQAVAAFGSISRAAKELHLAQSAISRQIALLEESLKEDLFFRGTRGVTLTSKGKILFQRISELDNWVGSEFFEQSLPLRIGGLEGALNMWLGPRLAKAAPSKIPRRLLLHPMSNDQIRSSLEKGELDIGLSSLKIESEWATSRKIYSEKIYLISREKIDINELEKHSWIGVNRTVLLRRLSKNRSPDRFIQAGSIGMLLTLVKAGHGIAAVSEHFIADCEDLVVTPTLLPSEAIYLNLPSYLRLPKHIGDFVKHFFGSVS